MAPKNIIIVKISIGTASFKAACQASPLGSTLLTDMAQQLTLAWKDEDTLYDFIHHMYETAREAGLVAGVVMNGLGTI
jgi:hypothetical protein